jgi:hypothetical protein
VHCDEREENPRTTSGQPFSSGQDVLCAGKGFFITFIHKCVLVGFSARKPGRFCERKILKANHSGGRRCQDGPQRSEEYLDSTSRPTAVFMCV